MHYAGYYALKVLANFIGHKFNLLVLNGSALCLGCLNLHVGAVLAEPFKLLLVFGFSVV